MSLRGGIDEPLTCDYTYRRASGPTATVYVVGGVIDALVPNVPAALWVRCRSPGELNAHGGFVVNVGP